MAESKIVEFTQLTGLGPLQKISTTSVSLSFVLLTVCLSVVLCVLLLGLLWQISMLNLHLRLVWSLPLQQVPYQDGICSTGCGKGGIHPVRCVCLFVRRTYVKANKASMWKQFHLRRKAQTYCDLITVFLWSLSKKKCLLLMYLFVKNTMQLSDWFTKTKYAKIIKVWFPERSWVVELANLTRWSF